MFNRTEKGLWWDEGWKLVSGCTRVSSACDNCWALDMDKRFDGLEIKFHPERLEKPLKRKKPQSYSIWNDLFHESVYEDWLNSVFNMMGVCQWHNFIILTKRPKRMVKYITPTYAPMKNVILGVTAENQERADERLSELMKLAKAGWKTVVSVEPMLSEIKSQWLPDWVICGCESGPNRRPMDIEWARDLKNQCEESGVAFFMKQMEIDGKVCKDISQFPEDLRIREYPESEAINE